ncbi:unnamed protein product [Amoebophrya sp. A120]|nr:unnamed protein product [Amoebophrya sp. A120]|eukprot:GSA120T00002622001.1
MPNSRHEHARGYVGSAFQPTAHADEETLLLAKYNDGARDTVEGNLKWTQAEAVEQVQMINRAYRKQAAAEIDSDLSDEEAAPEVYTYEEYHDKIDKVWEKTDWNARGDEQIYKLSTFGAITSLLASIFGVGILEQPKAVQGSGFLAGMLALVLSTVVSYYGGVYLGLAARMTGKKSFGEISREAGGAFGVFLSVYALLGLCILASVAYAVSWYRYTMELYVRAGWLTSDQAGSTDIISARSLVITLMLMLLYPVCCLRDLSALGTVSTGAAGVYVSLLFLMFYYWVSDYLNQSEEGWNSTIRKDWTPQLDADGKVADVAALNHPCNNMFDYKLEWVYSGDWKALFSALALMNTAFACHFSCVDVFGKELKNPTRKVINKILVWTMGISFFVYGAFTCMGWAYASKFQDYTSKALFTADGDNQVLDDFSATCKQGAQDKILGNMREPGMEFNPALVAIAEVVVFLVLFLTFPLFINASRSTIHGLVWGDKPSSNGLHLLQTLGLIVLIWLLAVFIPGVTTILAYAGAGPGVTLVLILPGYLMLCLNKHLSFCHPHRIVPLLVLILGVIVSAGGIALTAMYSDDLERGMNLMIVADPVSYYNVKPATVKIDLGSNPPATVFPDQAPDHKERVHWFDLQEQAGQGKILLTEDVDSAEKVRRYEFQHRLPSEETVLDLKTFPGALQYFVNRPQQIAASDAIAADDKSAYTNWWKAASRCNKIRVITTAQIAAADTKIQELTLEIANNPANKDELQRELDDVNKVRTQLGSDQAKICI